MSKKLRDLFSLIKLYSNVEKNPDEILSDLPFFEKIQEILKQDPFLINQSIKPLGETVLTQTLSINLYTPTTLNLNIRLLKFLLQKGANPNIKLADGRTPLIMAIENHSLHQVRTLLEIHEKSSNETIPENKVEILTKSIYLDKTVSKNVFGLLIMQQTESAKNIIIYLLNNLKSPLKSLEYQELIRDCIRFNNHAARETLKEYHRQQIIQQPVIPAAPQRHLREIHPISEHLLPSHSGIGQPNQNYPKSPLFGRAHKHIKLDANFSMPKPPEKAKPLHNHLSPLPRERKFKTSTENLDSGSNPNQSILPRKIKINSIDAPLNNPLALFLKEELDKMTLLITVRLFTMHKHLKVVEKKLIECEKKSISAREHYKPRTLC